MHGACDEHQIQAVEELVRYSQDPTCRARFNRLIESRARSSSQVATATLICAQIVQDSPSRYWAAWRVVFTLVRYASRITFDDCVENVAAALQEHQNMESSHLLLTFVHLALVRSKNPTLVASDLVISNVLRTMNKFSSADMIQSVGADIFQQIGEAVAPASPTDPSRPVPERLAVEPSPPCSMNSQAGANDSPIQVQEQPTVVAGQAKGRTNIHPNEGNKEMEMEVASEMEMEVAMKRKREEVTEENSSAVQNQNEEAARATMGESVSPQQVVRPAESKHGRSVEVSSEVSSSPAGPTRVLESIFGAIIDGKGCGDLLAAATQYYKKRGGNILEEPKMRLSIAAVVQSLIEDSALESGSETESFVQNAYADEQLREKLLRNEVCVAYLWQCALQGDIVSINHVCWALQHVKEAIISSVSMEREIVPLFCKYGTLKHLRTILECGTSEQLMDSRILGCLCSRGQVLQSFNGESEAVMDFLCSIKAITSYWEARKPFVDGTLCVRAFDLFLDVAEEACNTGVAQPVVVMILRNIALEAEARLKLVTSGSWNLLLKILREGGTSSTQVASTCAWAISHCAQDEEARRFIMNTSMPVVATLMLNAALYHEDDETVALGMISAFQNLVVQLPASESRVPLSTISEYVITTCGILNVTDTGASICMHSAQFFAHAVQVDAMEKSTVLLYDLVQTIYSPLIASGEKISADCTAAMCKCIATLLSEQSGSPYFVRLEMIPVLAHLVESASATDVLSALSPFCEDDVCRKMVLKEHAMPWLRLLLKRRDEHHASFALQMGSWIAVLLKEPQAVANDTQFILGVQEALRLLHGPLGPTLGTRLIAAATAGHWLNELVVTAVTSHHPDILVLLEKQLKSDKMLNQLMRLGISRHNKPKSSFPRNLERIIWSDLLLDAIRMKYLSKVIAKHHQLNGASKAEAVIIEFYSLRSLYLNDSNNALENESFTGFFDQHSAQESPPSSTSTEIDLSSYPDDTSDDEPPHLAPSSQQGGIIDPTDMAKSGDFPPCTAALTLEYSDGSIHTAFNYTKISVRWSKKLREWIQKHIIRTQKTQDQLADRETPTTVTIALQNFDQAHLNTKMHHNYRQFMVNTFVDDIRQKARPEME
jgi:hypothetical protein